MGNLFLARMFTVALVLVGPIGHYYYSWLARTWPQRSVQIVMFKIIFDQFVISPVNITAFFFGMSALEMKNFFEAVQELREKFITIYTVSTFILFTFICIYRTNLKLMLYF